MELFYLQMMLLVVSSIVVMFVSVLGAAAYHGVRIYFLIKEEKGNKKERS